MTRETQNPDHVATAVITEISHTHIWAALRQIEIDNGGHLIGRVYPGEPVNLNEFQVHGYWPIDRLDRINKALERLRYTSPGWWLTFVCGEETEALEIQRKQGDLAGARVLLDAYFNGRED